MKVRGVLNICLQSGHLGDKMKCPHHKGLSFWGELDHSYFGAIGNEVQFLWLFGKSGHQPPFGMKFKGVAT